MCCSMALSFHEQTTKSFTARYAVYGVEVVDYEEYLRNVTYLIVVYIHHA